MTWFRWRVDLWAVGSIRGGGVELAVRHGCHRRSYLRLDGRRSRIEVNVLINWLPPDHDSTCPWHLDRDMMKAWVDLERRADTFR